MDSMVIISLIGVIVGVVLFIFMSVKGFQLVISACTASLVIILTSGMPILEMVTGKWMTGFSNFLNSRFTIQVQHMEIGKKGVTHRRRCPKMVFVDSQERGSIL